MKSKKPFNLAAAKKIAIGAILTSVVLFSGISALTSWLSYRNYYAEMLDRKEAYDEANATPYTKLNNITLSLAPGVNFYDNGKANPTKNDFVVTGHFSISGRDYEETLTDYDLTIPDDFAEKGGTVKVSYTYKETKTYDEKTEVKTENGTETVTTPVEKNFRKEYDASLDVPLTPVVPEKLVLKQNPYTVCYAEGETFQKEGLEAYVLYNDGSKYDGVNPDDIAVQNINPLTTKDTSVLVTYDMDGTLIGGDVPIQVLPKDSFTNGESLEIYARSTPTVLLGQQLQETKGNFFVRYESGNIKALQDYTMTFDGYSLTDRAELGKDYQMTLETKDGSKKNFPVSVKANLQAEDATFSDCSKETVQGKEVVSSFTDASWLDFTVDATDNIQSDLLVTLSNGYVQEKDGKYYTSSIAPDSYLNLSVNGELKDVDTTSFVQGGPYTTREDALSSFQTLKLGRVYLKKGENHLCLNFRKNIQGVKNDEDEEPYGKIDSLTLETRSASSYNSFGEYFLAKEESNEVPSLAISRVRGWSNMVLPYIVGAASDGTYLYFAVTSPTDPGSTGDKTFPYSYPVNLVKYDPDTDTVLGASEAFNIFSEVQWTHFANVPLYYKSGYVYAFDADFEAVKIPTSDIQWGNTVPAEKAEDCPITSEQMHLLIDIDYCKELQRYVMMGRDGFVHIYDKSMNEVSNFAASGGFSLMADKDTITLYKGSIWDQDSLSTTLEVYDYDGNHHYGIPLDLNSLRDESDTGTNASLRGLVQAGENVYIAARGWSSPWASSLFKASFKAESTSSKPLMNLGSYLDAASSQGVSPSFQSTQINSSSITGLPNYVHGYCSDGTYTYVSANQGTSTKVYKVDPKQSKVLASTASVPRKNDSTNGDYLFYKDGWIYLICFDEEGTIRRVKTEALTSNRTAEFETVTDITLPKGQTALSGTYNRANDSYAFLMRDVTTLAFVNGSDGSLRKTVTVAGRTALGMASDATHVYLFYELAADSTNATRAGIAIYDWDGNFVRDAVLNHIFSLTGGTNVQGMVSHDGYAEILVCNWALRGMYAVQLNFDYSVLSD